MRLAAVGDHQSGETYWIAEAFNISRESGGCRVDGAAQRACCCAVSRGRRSLGGVGRRQCSPASVPGSHAASSQRRSRRPQPTCGGV